MDKEYIEREPVLKLLEEIKNDFSPTVRPMFGVFKHILTEAPAADVKPVVRGKWYDEDCFDAHGSPIYRCSVCNKTVADNYISAHKHCLHCGAEMEEVK